MLIPPIFQILFDYMYFKKFEVVQLHFVCFQAIFKKYVFPDLIHRREGRKSALQP
jgi:hypothetical protein